MEWNKERSHFLWIGRLLESLGPYQETEYEVAIDEFPIISTKVKERGGEEKAWSGTNSGKRRKSLGHAACCHWWCRSSKPYSCTWHNRAKDKKDKKPVKETVTRVFTINLHKRIHGVYVAADVLLSHLSTTQISILPLSSLFFVVFFPPFYFFGAVEHVLYACTFGYVVPHPCIFDWA